MTIMDLPYTDLGKDHTAILSNYRSDPIGFHFHILPKTAVMVKSYQQFSYRTTKSI